MSFIVRPARQDDLEPIYEMAKLTGAGFTNLPPEKPWLNAKIARSIAAFARTEDTLADELFMFVLENLATREVRGTCQIFSQVGQSWPFYSYRIGTVTMHSIALGRTFRAETLSLVNDLDGSSEVGGLFLHPDERASGLGLLLARSRYLFIAMHRARFADRVLAELRGVVDESGRSPFWDGIAGRFFGMDFQQADEFNAINGNQFITELMPKHPIYTAMLSEPARTAIGQPHPSGRAAMRMLEHEGFVFENYVDIFDGGPTMAARTDQIVSVRDSVTAHVIGLGESGTPSIIATGRLGDFRACYGQVLDQSHGVLLDPKAAAALNIDMGQEVRHVPC